jgi:hypothetical protein
MRGGSMSKVLETTFDCGYTVTYTLIKGEEPNRYVKRTFEMTAEAQHKNNCQQCKERATTEE